MSTERKDTSIERYESHFAKTLRDLMQKNGTTQKELAKAVGIRQQSLGQYVSGETMPNVEKVLKIAEYFHVTTDYLITGTVIEDIPVREMLGLTEQTVECMKLVKEGYFEDTPAMLSMLDYVLSSKDFYQSLDMAASYMSKKDDALSADMQEFYEWKASVVMQNFFLEMFGKNLFAIYVEKEQQ